MQLVAYGAQDIYLTGNPQITFFKVVYRRHTNFSMESIEQTFNGTKNFGNRVSATISRNGDLVHKMYIRCAISGSTGSAANVTHALLEDVEVEIGGQKIDKHYGHWLETWAELTQPNELGVVAGYANGAAQGAATGDGAGIGNCAAAATLFQKMSLSGGCNQDAANVLDQFVDAYVPLQFWFCRNPGLALPLIALQYHEVKVLINIASTGTTATSVAAAGTLDRFELWVDYIYLDTDERRRFAQVSHEYLIEQLQFERKGAAETTMDLNFNHPVKELIWTGVADTAITAGFASNEGPAVPETLNGSTFKIKLNGHDRFTDRDLMYFTRTQVKDYHSGHGGVTVRDSIAVYSFALKPEEHQPSGTCNFSRIDSAQLVAGTAQGGGGTNIYAINYNVLRIMSGMGGLAYSN